jgi:ribonucleoside-diphosphate reductase alpha chain
MELANSLIHQVYQPATPTFMNVGKVARGSLISCFLINLTDDLNSIGRSFNSVIQLSKEGGGVGISLTNLRESGAPIKGIPNSASGVVPVMKNYEDQLSYANQLG